MQDSDSSSWQHCQIMVTVTPSKKMWPQILTKLPSTFRVLYFTKRLFISGHLLALSDLEKLDQFEKENQIFFSVLRIYLVYRIGM